jgi:hypothetical protein
MPFQQNRAEIRRRVALVPGWAMVWMLVKTSRRYCSGTIGRVMPLEMSQRMWPDAKGKACRRRLDPSSDCVEGQDRCAAAIAAKSTAPPVAAVIAAKVAAGSGGRDDTWPALKAAAADPAGAFTAAAAEAGEEDDDGEFPPALKAATANPGGTFTAVAAEAGGTAPGGRERVSATMLLTPATWRISEVYSATYDRWRACLAVHGSETLLRAYVRGLWSVNMVNRRPSSIWRKCRIPREQASNSRSKAEYLV